MSAVPAKVLNDLFFDKVASAEGKEKIAEFSGTYIRDRLREVSFSDKVLPPKPVQRTECQRSVNHDTLVKIVDIEPNSKAMSMSFRGQPTARMIRAPRFEIPFYTISSEKFEKVEQELLAYEMPITKIIEENTVKDLQSIKDRQFLLHVEACVQAMQLEANANTAVAVSRTTVNAGTVVLSSVIKGEKALAASSDTFLAREVQKNDFVKLKKLLHRRNLRANQVLMTEPDYDDVSTWTVENVGHQIAGDTTTEGYKAGTIVGLKVIRTIKTEILREGNIYCFTEPDFFGRSYILNQTKFYIDKVANVITWQSWLDVGMGIGNIAGVVKLETYSASTTPGAETTSAAAAAAVRPLSEDSLYPVNNRVDSGGVFPKVSTF